jgi:P pilus assembly chaperone PapD
MRNRVVAATLLVIILASGVLFAAWFYSQPGRMITLPTTRPHEGTLLTAACAPVGNTGEIVASNTGAIAVNLTSLIITNSTGQVLVDSGLGNGVVIEPGSNATISNGYRYSGHNVLIRVISEIGNEFTTTCP